MSTVPQTNLPTVSDTGAADVVESKIAQSFIPFSRLPPELRIKIWEEAKAEPRVIYIVEHEESWGDFGNISSIKSSCGPSSLLSTNHESRHVVLKDYTIMKQGLLRAFVNVPSDIFYFSCYATFINYFDGLGVTSNEMLTLVDIKSHMQHVIIDDSYTDINDLDLNVFGPLEGLSLQSLTLHATFHSNEDDKVGRKKGWSDLWVEKAQPKIFLIPEDEMTKLKGGDITWWQAEMANSRNLNVVIAKDEGHIESRGV